MAQNSPRKCPHCKFIIPVDRDFSFDEKLNMICGNCSRIVVPTEEKKQRVTPESLGYSNGYPSRADHPHPYIPHQEDYPPLG